MTRLFIILAALTFSPDVLGHGVTGTDAAFVSANAGANIAAFVYLGAKHMVTGLDHLLFLSGVIFFIHRTSDVVLYVTLFSVGHSITLLYGVLAGVQASSALVDAIIGVSVVYKAFDNLGGLKMMGLGQHSRSAVLAFGLAHGFGLATKLRDAGLAAEGRVVNLLSFNLGVEMGQILALIVVLAVMTWWRGTPQFQRQAVAANVGLMIAGFCLTQYHLAAYALTEAK